MDLEYNKLIYLKEYINKNDCSNFYKIIDAILEA
jgi:hypothetical protein